MKRKAWVTIIIVAVIFAGGGFFTGTKYAASKTPSSAGTASFAGRTGGFAGRAGGGFGGAGGGATIGTILTIGNGTMTIQLPNSTSTTADTGTQIILFDNQTQVTALENVSPSSLQVGQAVTISGSTNSDGSLTATSIMARPAGSSGSGQFTRQGATTPTGSGQ